jgi:hypothetical protein
LIFNQSAYHASAGSIALRGEAYGDGPMAALSTEKKMKLGKIPAGQHYAGATEVTIGHADSLECKYTC